MPWTALTPMKTARTHHAAVSLGNKIFVLGGIGLDGQTLGSVEIYDPVVGQWTEGPCLDSPRSHLSALTLGERLFALGGKSRRQDGSEAYHRTVEIFQAATQKWEKGPDLLGMHASAGAGIWRGIPYIAGGEDPNGSVNDNAGSAFAERWDPLRKKWFQIPPIPTPRFGTAALGFNARLIVLGGAVRRGQKLVLYDRSEAYNPATGKWEDYPLTLLPEPTEGLGACSMANLFIIGGRGQNGLLDRVYSVDQLQRRWIGMDSLPEPRAHAQVLTNVAQLDNSIYVLGGENADGNPSSTLFAYKP